MAPSISRSGGSRVIRRGAEYAMDKLSELFRTPVSRNINIDIKTEPYTYRPIPIGMRQAYKHMSKYLQIYNRLPSEAKQELRDVDRKLLILKQAQTRLPVDSEECKSLYERLGNIINTMDTEIKDEKKTEQNIEELKAVMQTQPTSMVDNRDPLLDNSLGLGLGQVSEMKRGGNFLPQLVISASEMIPQMLPSEIAPALNSVIQNVTEIELGGVQRVGAETSIPQIDERQAQDIKEIIAESRSGSLLADESATKGKQMDISDNQKQTDNKENRLRKMGETAIAGGLTAVGLGKLTDLAVDTVKNIYSNIMETPIKIPETQAQSDQKISSAAGNMRPRFIVPSRDSVIPSMPKIRADDIQFAAFDYVQPRTEGGNGNARTNPLVLSQELEERLRYTNAGITISPGMGENVVNITLTESELKALLLPRGPEISPVIYEFPIIDGDQAQNEVKKYDQNLIQVEKFSPYNEYNDNDQLDEEIFGSILLSYVP
jgi:vacuolar-type H+-ATPase subunit H